MEEVGGRRKVVNGPTTFGLKYINNPISLCFGGVSVNKGKFPPIIQSDNPCVLSSEFELFTFILLR